MAAATLAALVLLVSLLPLAPGAARAEPGLQRGEGVQLARRLLPFSR